MELRIGFYGVRNGGEGGLGVHRKLLGTVSAECCLDWLCRRMLNVCPGVSQVVGG